ncbi:hypothetical protein C1J03_13000 [Sulfitobacter sp. SK012]|uniref:hypothetical protein n=1 Tax=Sulfitobacter sp. SK012 TaxID=1389005 RepID=UPI000E0A526C|nr:hypothetical protein [Sulfitobacter sp. SK012]AXI46859.1 hypothetical protein C1J03_13000 [Sulfitobacter sp. SK012]
MNIERLTKLADFIQTNSDPKFRFDTTVSLDTFGTAGCIAGTAVHLFGDTRGMRYHDMVEGYFWEDIQAQARDLLGLPQDEPDLFDYLLAPAPCTLKDAAEAIRRVMVGKEAWTTRSDDTPART